MNLKLIHKVYFIGIGGIGMSALARYFAAEGKKIAGYDKISSPLTEELSSSGIKIHYSDDIKLIPKEFLNSEETLIVFTPAVPASHSELDYFRKNSFKVHKRAEVLGYITKDKKAVCVAGTHGKTTITTMITWIMHHSETGCSAFLGGISKNFNSNYVRSSKSEYIIVEADEYDRSFLWLHPDIAVITATDADHLDIYETHEEVIKSFEAFTSQIHRHGRLIIKRGIDLKIQQPEIEAYTYALHGHADFYAENIRLENGRYHFDVVTPVEIIKNLSISHPGLVNVENAVAAVAIATLSGISRNIIKEWLPEFKGIKRRFDYIFKSDKVVYIDDYAHHPEEIQATIKSVRELYPGRRITGIFQPHLYSRTRDFADEFAETLSNLDELILLDIYPARELPIEGVDSNLILNKVKLDNKTLIIKGELLKKLEERNIDILITMGAGDIDAFCNPIRQLLIKKFGKEE